VPAVAVAPVVAAKRRWPWWLWLLLLLLLLLLLCWLFCRCSPEELTLPPMEPTREQPLDELDPRRPDLDVDEIERRRLRGDRIGVDGVEGTDVEGLGEEELETEGNTFDDEAGTPEDEALPDEPAGEEGEEGAEEPLGEDPTGEDETGEEPPMDDPLAPDETGDTGPDGADGTDAPGDEPAGAPLEIPEQALAEGSTEFLEGKWRSSTDLETADHEPVDLSYDFEDGKGEVKLHRGRGADRVDCTGQASSEMRGGRLIIHHKNIRCPDGSGFQDSRVECAVGEDGRAGCDGVNAADGTKYDVDITR
jgi:hypothetical protein